MSFMTEPQTWTVLGLMCMLLGVTGTYLVRYIGAKFETVGAKFDAIDMKFDAIDTKFDAIGTKFDAIDTKFAAMDTKFDLMLKRMDNLDRDIHMLIQRELDR